MEEARRAKGDSQRKGADRARKRGTMAVGEKRKRGCTHQHGRSSEGGGQADERIECGRERAGNHQDPIRAPASRQALVEAEQYEDERRVGEGARGYVEVEREQRAVEREWIPQPHVPEQWVCESPQKGAIVRGYRVADPRAHTEHDRGLQVRADQDQEGDDGAESGVAVERSREPAAAGDQRDRCEQAQ